MTASAPVEHVLAEPYSARRNGMRPLPRAAERDEDSLTGAVDALVVLMDTRDKSMSAHASHAASLAGRLAAELECDPAQCFAVRVAARLHDLGKVAVPDAILLKPGALTESEWVLMKKHPVIGSDVLNRIPALCSLAPMVRAHHERWDGTGYPDGLAGTEIPLPARILSVADAFDAMVAARLYSPPMGRAAALSEVRRCSGTQFDPRVVVALERILRLPLRHRP